MTSTETVRITSLDDAVESVWEMIAAKEAANSAEAVRILWPSIRLKRDELEHLALQGLIEYADAMQRHAHSQRGPAIAVGSPHGKQWDAYLVSLAGMFEDSAGQQKPLLEFTLTDWAAFSTRMRKLAQAYNARADFGEVAQKLLAKHKAETTADLPADVLGVFAQHVSEVLSTR